MARRARPLAATAVLVALVTFTPSPIADDRAHGAQTGGVDYALEPIPFGDLDGFAQDDHFEAFQVFARSCAAIVDAGRPLREALAATPALVAVCRRALSAGVADGADARRFFEESFRPCRVSAGPQGRDGFFTGYYEPLVEGSLTPGPGFAAPLLARPDDLASFPPGQTASQIPGSGSLGPEFAAGRRLADGSLVPYPDRAAIEDGAIADRAAPVVWLRDPVEAFLVHVQGSARVRLPDGRLLRLVYAGRNGHPYTSIGRILVETGAIAASDMSLARLKQWIRDEGQQPFEAGGALMRRNRSFIFFALDKTLDPSAGPIGGEGLSLTPLRSIAIDRALWPYGLPVWVEAELPWRSETISPFRRLMIAQDTGSAIVGPARADIFFGSGDDAGARAGDIRHAGAFIVFLPVEQDPNR